MSVFELPDYNVLGPPGSYDTLYAHYGNPAHEDFERTYLRTVYHEVGGKQTPMRVHVAIADKLHSVWSEMNFFKVTLLLTEFDGSYVVRTIREGTKPSLHSWGLALDFNSKEYPLRSLKRFPKPLIDCWKRYGFVNGADFHSRKDPMHFQYTKPGTI